MKQKRLGDMLIAEGVLTESQINEALSKKENGERIG